VLGMRRTQLVTSLLIEGAAIVVLGVLVGFAGGIAGASFVLPHVLTPPQPFEVALSLPYRLPYSILVRSSALVVILGAFAIAASAARVVGRASFEQLRAGER
jgi:ABC-type antimicrobial peptide transport system permease subunit